MAGKENIEPINIEELLLTPGIHAYLLRDDTDYKEKRTLTLEEIFAQAEKEAVIMGEIKQKVESLGGSFIAVRTLDAKIPDPDWMDSAFPHRLTFLFASLP